MYGKFKYKTFRRLWFRDILHWSHDGTNIVMSSSRLSKEEILEIARSMK